MKQKEGGKQRFSLTLFFAAIVIVIILAVFLVVWLMVFIFTKLSIPGVTVNGNVPMMQLLLIFGAACLGVGCVLTMLLSTIPLKPVNELLNIMKRLAGGDFTPRIELQKPWDKFPWLVELAESFNKMAHELQSTETLRHDFINEFSHEFKTPIVSIAGFAGLLNDETLDEQQREYVRIIREESLRLSQMATNVLSLTKLENQTILGDVSRYNLSEQLRYCILLLSSKWEDKNIDLELELCEEEISGSEELLKQLWINLIDNAIKFSPDGGIIGVSVSGKKDIVEVRISNLGPEISPEEQRKIFNKFYQSDKSRATQGNGVGLAIVKRVVHLHNGRVEVESSGGVNCFTVRLPKK